MKKRNRKTHQVFFDKTGEERKINAQIYLYIW